VEALSKMTPQPWPAWPVAPGILTDHGQGNVRIMAAWLRADYARRGLWPATGCPAPGEVYAWADGQDERTRVSGQTTLDGAFPGCGLVAHHGPEGQPDPLFSAASHGVCPEDPDQAREAMLAEVKGDLDQPDPRYADGLKTLKTTVYGDGGTCAPGQSCPLDGPNSLRPGKDGVRLTGPLATGATMAENLVLEYTQGFPKDQVGWGRAGADRISRIMALHDIQAQMIWRAPYIATHNGALIGRAVLAALQGGEALPDPGAKGSRLTIISGHDTNLGNMAGVLGVRWRLPGQPDTTPPDGTLAFEVWKDPANGERFVRVAMIYQSLEDLRSGAALDPAHPAGRVEVPVPGCADGPAGACRLSTFASLIGSRLPAECVLKP
jgi:4-phytase/acid phosphatase